MVHYVSKQPICYVVSVLNRLSWNVGLHLLKDLAPHSDIPGEARPLKESIWRNYQWNRMSSKKLLLMQDEILSLLSEAEQRSVAGRVDKLLVFVTCTTLCCGRLTFASSPCVVDCTVLLQEVLATCGRVDLATTECWSHGTRLIWGPDISPC